MRLLLAPSLALIAALPLIAVEQPAPAPASAAAIDVTAPESAILLPARVLRDNNFKAFFLNLPAEDQAKAKADWKLAQEKQVDPAAGEQGLTEINKFLGQLLAPDAAETLTVEAEPKLTELNPQEISQGLQMMAGFLPMMLQANANANAQDPAIAAERAAWMGMLQGILTDASTWVLTAGINDRAKLKQAITHLVVGAKALGVTDARELQALPLEEFLARLSPVVKEAKAGLAIYGLQADAFLSSLTAVSQGQGDERTLQVTLTAFGKPYTVPIHVMKKDNHWVFSPKNAETLGGMKQLMPGAGSDEPQGFDMPPEAVEAKDDKKPAVDSPEPPAPAPITP